MRKFLLYGLPEPRFALCDPLRRTAGGNFPGAIPFNHFKKDAFTSFVTNVDGELLITRAFQFPEIKLPDPVTGLHQQGKLDHSAELELHTNQLRK